MIGCTSVERIVGSRILPKGEFVPLSRRRVLLNLSAAWLIGLLPAASPRAADDPDDIVILDGWVLKRGDLAHLPGGSIGAPSRLS